jgi:hypothetical protein
MIAALLGLVVCIFAVTAAEKEPRKKDKTKGDKASEKSAWAPAVEPKPLTDKVKSGLDWLAEHQLASGGWGQGEESQHMGGGGQLKDVPSVADTSIAALALLRSGSTPAKGPYAKQLLKAARFVCGRIEESDGDSLYITDTRGTRVQSKLGPYIDTFMANLFLSETQGSMPKGKDNKRVNAALKKVLAKIEKNQRSDGTWGGEGWAPTLSQNIAVKGLNRARQAGQPVDEAVLEKSEGYSRQQFDKSSGKFSDTGTAGVALYGAASNLGALSDSVNTGQQRQEELQAKVASASTPAVERQEARETLKRIDGAKKDLEAAQSAVVARLDDKAFIAGFGSNGGEEFLSYMNIGESLVVKGGKDWKSWDKSITENLNRVQNSDGSWTGHHCITGRTFCTASALLVLMVDRTPVPIAAKIGRR